MSCSKPVVGGGDNGGSPTPVQPDPPKPTEQIIIESSVNLEPVVDATGGTIKIPFSTTASWTASASAAWVEVNPNSGAQGSAEITVNVSPNESYEDRASF